MLKMTPRFLTLVDTYWHIEDYPGVAMKVFCGSNYGHRSVDIKMGRLSRQE